MNICFLEGDMSRRGGTERMTALLANAFCEKDKVWVISKKSEENQIFFKLDKRIEHKVLSKGNTKVDIIKQISEIRKFIQKNKIEWIINVDVGMAIFGIPASWGTRTKTITWEHANYYNNWNSRVFPYFRRFAAKHSDVMVVLTEQDRKNYLTNIPSKVPVYVIANPAEKHMFCYNTESKIILSAGLLLPIKGYDKAIQAAAKVLPKYPDWKWIICGNGPERKHLEELIGQNELQEQVLLYGTIKNMDEQYQKAAMFVMTSEMEGLPMVLLEAKSWGLPLISFDIMTGPSDIIRSGVNGYLVRANDVNDLAEHIEKLIQSKEKRMKFSLDSQLDMERFDFDEIIEKWRTILH